MDPSILAALDEARVQLAALAAPAESWVRDLEADAAPVPCRRIVADLDRMARPVLRVRLADDPVTGTAGHRCHAAVWRLAGELEAEDRLRGSLRLEARGGLRPMDLDLPGPVDAPRGSPPPWEEWREEL
ncbi:MAG: hypothetical protein FJ098_16895, partial [Deltaproteobacteria bacterium]|nr:hypothetical protein [Deltaproteobacteria bacterium]